MRIVLVINSLQGGGAEKFVLTLGDALVKLDHKVDVVYFEDIVEHTLSPHLRYHLLPFGKLNRSIPKSIRYRLFARQVDALIGKLAPDVVLVNLYRAYEVFWHSKLAAQGIAVIFVLHNYLSIKLDWHKLSPKKQRYYHNVFTKYPTVAFSHGMAQDFKQLFTSQQPITVIHNPIDQAAIEHLAAAFTPDLAQNYIVHVGSFKPQKNHALLLRAYAKSSRRYPLVLVGKGVLETQIRTLIKEFNLQDDVILAGFQSNPYPFVKNARGFVLSSDFEGMPIALMEAVALAVPAISTDCPSVPNEILPTNNLIPVGDSDALTAKLEALMQHPADFIAPFNRQFLPENVAQQYVDFALRTANSKTS